MERRRWSDRAAGKDEDQALQSPEFLSSSDRAGAWLLIVVCFVIVVALGAVSVRNQTVPVLEVVGYLALLAVIRLYTRERAGRSISFDRRVIRLHSRQRVLEEITVSELAEVSLGGPFSEARFVAKDGRSIVVPTNQGRWRGVADEIAQVLPYHVRLEAVRRHGAGSLRKTGVGLVAAGCLLCAVVWLREPWLVIPALILAPFAVVRGVMMILAARNIAQDIDSVEPLRRLDTEEISGLIRAGMWFPVEIVEGARYVYPPRAARHRPLAYGLQALASVVLGCLTIRFLAELNNISAVAFCTAALLAVYGLWHSGPRFWRSIHLPDQVWFEGDEVCWERRGVQGLAPVDKARMMRLGRWLHSVWLAGEGRNVAWIDPGFLIRDGSPRYAPESPWEDLWRGRAPTLPRWLE